MTAHRSLARLALVLVLASGAAARAHAELVLEAPGGERALPPIPEAQDVRLTPEEWRRVQDGGWVVQIVTHSKEDRQARAIGFVASSPVAMFDVATDSEVAVSFDEIESATILESSPQGKRYEMTVDPSFVLPSFHFVSVAAYNEIGTAQTFGQIEGDFQRNEGTHSYLWDPKREQTLAVVTFAFGLKGVLGILPESWILRMASHNLPKAIQRLDAVAAGFAEEDPERFARIDAEWQLVRARIEAGEFPGFLWTDPPGDAPP